MLRKISAQKNPANPGRELSIGRRSFVQGGLALGAGLLLAQGAAFGAQAAAPSRGGVLRIGLGAAGSKSSLNPFISTGEMDFAVAQSLFDRLTDFDATGKLYNSLAEDFSHNEDGSIWTIRIRDGVLWHDGSPFTAQDVAYSLAYILTPENKADAYATLSPFMQKDDVRALDATTVEIKLNAPYALLPQIMASKVMFLVKDGTRDFSAPIGTGPFKFTHWTQGERVSLARNESFRTPGQPYLDGLEFIAINDAMSRVNALMAGQVDVIAQLDGSLAPIVEANPALHLIRSESGATTDQFMMVNKAPFQDVRVRQAFRLMVDRPQLVSNALAGYGRIGNDLHSITDPDYAAELPQRAHDPDQGRALLKAAGYDSDLRLELYTADAAPGMLASSTLIANQAKQIGVTIDLTVVPPDSYYSGPQFKNAPMASSDWGQHTLESVFGQAYARGAYWNEPDWTSDAFDGWVAKSRTTFDETLRKQYLFEAQKILWNEGGYLIWGFRDLLDAASAKVAGLAPSNQRNLGYYRFEGVSLEG
ncbi:ABC transporter substrate-binding protein [Paracoccus aminophilus]|uniref:Peptide/nickel transport system, substrate-binding protein n=1 Tax=Paracoccus aminophilus JCM 7686 TaxID=1367847 RepID=S5XZN0_PARAH|nr:ABC transporter substrate-binding protein [Paracoccus aminophilus]AGT08900.1 peptide/nickel transport system, substrate-binding protein [Paracoccus aminophilus JCM 7686]